MNQRKRSLETKQKTHFFLSEKRGGDRDLTRMSPGLSDTGLGGGGGGRKGSATVQFQTPLCFGFILIRMRGSQHHGQLSSHWPRQWLISLSARWKLLFFVRTIFFFFFLPWAMVPKTVLTLIPTTERYRSPPHTASPVQVNISCSSPFLFSFSQAFSLRLSLTYPFLFSFLLFSVFLHHLSLSESRQQQPCWECSFEISLKQCS